MNTANTGGNIWKYPVLLISPNTFVSTYDETSSPYLFNFGINILNSVNETYATNKGTTKNLTIGNVVGTFSLIKYADNIANNTDTTYSNEKVVWPIFI